MTIICAYYNNISKSYSVQIIDKYCYINNRGKNNMSVSSLTKFTVPLASDQSASNQGLLMPKLGYRFRVVFEGFGISTPRSELTKQVMKFGRPSVTMENKEIHVYNSIMNIAGKPKWDGVSTTIRDDASGNVARLVGEQMQKQFDFMEQSSAASGIDYKFITRLEITDGANGVHEPTILETWEMYGCYITKTAYSEADYTSDEPMTIQLDLKFDNALQIDLGSGIGAEVPRTAGDVTSG